MLIVPCWAVRDGDRLNDGAPCQTKHVFATSHDLPSLTYAGIPFRSSLEGLQLWEVCCFNTGWTSSCPCQKMAKQLLVTNRSFSAENRGVTCYLTIRTYQNRGTKRLQHLRTPYFQNFDCIAGRCLPCTAKKCGDFYNEPVGGICWELLGSVGICWDLLGHGWPGRERNPFTRKRSKWHYIGLARGDHARKGLKG